MCFADREKHQNGQDSDVLVRWDATRDSGRSCVKTSRGATVAVSGFDSPGFPHPHLKVTLTSWESRLGVVGSLNGGVVELARGIVRQVSVLWGLGMLRAP